MYCFVYQCSGIFDLMVRKPILLIAFNKKYIDAVEEQYEPERVITNFEYEFSNSTVKVECIENIDSHEVLKKFLDENLDKYDIIIHEENEENVKKFIDERVYFGFQSINVALSTRKEIIDKLKSEKFFPFQNPEPEKLTFRDSFR